MEYRGKIVIVLIFMIAMGLAGYAWLHQREAGRRSAEFWGTEAGICVRYAPRVEYVPLQPRREDSVENGTRINILGVEYSAGGATDISKTRGLVHVRHALVDDLSFDWTSNPTSDANWQFLLRFYDRDQVVTAAFDPSRGLVCMVDAGRAKQLIPKITAAFAQKHKEWQAMADR